MVELPDALASSSLAQTCPSPCDGPTGTAIVSLGGYQHRVNLGAPTSAFNPIAPADQSHARSKARVASLLAKFVVLTALVHAPCLSMKT